MQLTTRPKIGISNPRRRVEVRAPSPFGGSVWAEIYRGISESDESNAINKVVSSATSPVTFRIWKNDKFQIATIRPPISLGTSVIEDQGFWETHKSKFYIGGGVLMLLGVGFYGWKTLKSK